jgi:predicted nucleic acid-binding Zn ribbon protein
MWADIKNLLPLTVNKLGLRSIFEFNQLFIYWDKMMIENLGEDYKNKSRPISLKDKILTVDCLNSLWASEMQLRQSRIIGGINQRFNKTMVKEIRFIL